MHTVIMLLLRMKSQNFSALTISHNISTKTLSLNICTTCQHCQQSHCRGHGPNDDHSGKMLNSFRQNCLNPPSQQTQFSVSNEICDGSPLPRNSWCSTKFWVRNSISNQRHYRIENTAPGSLRKRRCTNPWPWSPCHRCPPPPSSILGARSPQYPGIRHQTSLIKSLPSATQETDTRLWQTKIARLRMLTQKSTRWTHFEQIRMTANI